MKGFMLTIQPYQSKPAVRELTGEPPLETVKQALGGGWLEQVPGFTASVHGGQRMRCVALCDEDGKYKHLEVNNWATIAWDHALRASGHPGLITSSGRVADFLVGTVVVLAGDA